MLILPLTYPAYDAPKPHSNEKDIMHFEVLYINMTSCVPSVNMLQNAEIYANEIYRST